MCLFGKGESTSLSNSTMQDFTIVGRQDILIMRHWLGGGGSNYSFCILVVKTDDSSHAVPLTVLVIYIHE